MDIEMADHHQVPGREDQATRRGGVDATRRVIGVATRTGMDAWRGLRTRSRG